MLPGCHGDLKGGVGAKLHNLIYARWGEEADILRTFLLEGEMWSFLSAFSRGALGMDRKWAELLRMSESLK